MDNWISQIDQNTNEFKQLVDTLSNEEINWKPNSVTWSVAQNIDHLIAINKSYFPTFKALKEKNNKLPFTSKFGFLVKMFGQQILKSVQPETKKKIKTFDIWEPQIGNLPDNIFTLFEANQEDLKQHISELTPLIKKDTIISSPANKYIVYKLQTAFDIIVAHENRHFIQSKGLLPQIKT